MAGFYFAEIWSAQFVHTAQGSVRQTVATDLHEALHATQRNPGFNAVHDVPGEHGDGESQQIEKGQCWEGHGRSEGVACAV